MTLLAAATVATLGLYPLNPTAQDTINTMNLHITAGVDGPSSVVGSGPDFTIKYEWLFNHPFIIRTAFEYRYGTVSSNIYPDGDMHRSLLMVEALYYRGTNKWTGYLGVGIVYSINSFSISPAAADSLLSNFGITNVTVTDVPGARITAGLRFMECYSLEIGITEAQPKYVYNQPLTDHSVSITRQKFRFNDFRVTVGYLFSLKS